MRKDFHYYGTYVAARLAGYDFSEAQTIAHASQYVDESGFKFADQSKLLNIANGVGAALDTEDLLRDAKGQYYIKDFTPVPTVQGNNEVTLYNNRIEWSGAHLLETSRVWVAFHFLPGNYGSNALEYTGPRKHKGTVTSWSYRRDSENQFKLICLPNSPLVKEMINDVVTNHNDNLPFIGLRMHVLADTWAHMYFAGIPSWFMNDAGQHVYEIDIDNKKTEIKWGAGPGREEAAPKMFYYNSYFYLGHGRMGHLPDYPYMYYEYQPQWSQEAINKDNRSSFLKAFKQLVMAMQCIRNNQSFNTDSYTQLAPEVEEVIKEVLYTREPMQCNTWKKNIHKIQIDGTPLEVPEEYQTSKWLAEFKEVSQLDSEVNTKTTEYYKFNYAAAQHLDLVIKHLESHEQFTLSGDEGKHTIDVTLKHGKRGYLGAMQQDLHIYGLTQYYAKMSKEAVPHRLIKVDSGPLRSGSIVQIQTTETKTGKYAYLGAWKVKSLYYYMKDFDLEKQRWEVVKVDLSMDDIIRPGDRVYIKNLYFDKNSYIAPYFYFYWFRIRYFLTTQPQPEEWILDWSE